ncbi:Meiotic recombination protein rec8 [Cytospora mali]|uniref:Meiotic recombination protein rec8 n=1 Tax=Cytospora mali TaxID=578113 RepID=A0A194UX10_CYTMA|nr:Meiotic recombination protein rec8 [Valsa mali var. pyri (nom. inval.)]
MFYSHEILASPQYGVATVWLVANNRKLNRKAIERVNVPRACTTIEKPPGAPIALRLQGNLLYGVSGVYSRQHAYLLDDAEKTWCAMRTFYRSLQLSASNEIDKNAGKAKRAQITLVDDPNFVPTMNLPPLDFDENGELLLPDWDVSQRTKLSTQLSPFESGGSGASPTCAPFINLDIRHSSSQGSLGIESPFGKGIQRPDDTDITMAFGDEEVLPFADFGLIIDAEGNLVEQPEPELPPYPPTMVEKAGGPHPPDDEGLIMPADEELQMIFGDEEQHFPEQIPAQNIPQQEGHDFVPLPSEELPTSESGTKESRQRKKRNIKRMAPDSATHVNREEFKSWTENYITRTEVARNRPHHVTATQAKKNAYNLTFGMGIMGIGVLNQMPGLDHPLAEFFAGDEFKSAVMGDSEEETEESRARRRRSASDAFGKEEEDDERRVRARLNEYIEKEQQVGRNAEQEAQIVDDPMVMFGDDLLPEVGREQPGSAMSDHRRSSNAPWNRPSSVVPSSIRSQKGVGGGRHAVEGSPLVGLGSILPADPKFSDGNMPLVGSDGFGPLPGDNHDLSALNESNGSAGIPRQEANTSQSMRDALDREGQNFLGFVERIAAGHGEDDESGKDRRWVQFDGLFEPQDQTRAVVAQAFLHVLTLATKGQVSVKQDGAKEKIPFGEIRVGVTGPFEEQFEDAPEEMEGVEETEE